MKITGLCPLLLFQLLFLLMTPGTGFSWQTLISNPDWSEDGRQLWYRTPGAADETEFVFVDCDSGTRHTIDRQRLQSSIGATSRIRLRSLRLLQHPQEVAVRIGPAWYRLNIETYQTETLDLADSDETDEVAFFTRPSPSGPSEERIDVRIVNQLEADLEIFWIDRRGETTSYGKIKRGAAFEIDTWVTHVWQVRAKDEPVLCFQINASVQDYILDAQAVEQASDHRTLRSATRRRRSPRENAVPQTQNRSRRSPDRKWSAEVEQHDLRIRNEDTSDVVELSTDAAESNSFATTAQRARLMQMRYDAQDPSRPTPVVYWSPDSRYLVAAQTTRVQEPMVRYIESSPRDQLQPRIDSYPYAKPGDDIPQVTYRIFSVEGVEIPLDQSLLENPFDCRFLRWSDDGTRFFLYFNQRGHQVVRLVEVTVATGATRAVFERTSDTFVHYSDSGKSVMEWIGDNEIIAASERTGWNHLYRIDLEHPETLQAITQGDWNVKRIIRLDQKTGVIWFVAVGVYPDQDPYHEHICRVNFDGSGFTLLTDLDATCEATTEPHARPYFVASGSRVDMPPVYELRSSETGKRICLLEQRKRDAEAHLPVRFSAKGRDGTTDIWGIIHFPRDMGPDKKYPVVEQIYAGPHNHFVPKRYRPGYGRARSFNERGMIVVQIDGMGTAWRSKAFHDVSYKNLKDAGFPDRIAWMKAAAEEYPQMDISRVGIYGGSAGGQNAMAALLWHNDFYSVAVADCGCHDNRMDKLWWNEQWMGWPVDQSYIDNSNMENAHLLQGHLMLTVGELDRNVDPASTTQVVRKLIEAEKDFEFVLIPGRGHGAGEQKWAARKRLEFFVRHLRPEP